MRNRTYFLLLGLGTFFLIVLNLPESVSVFLRGFCREAVATYQGALHRGLSGLDRQAPSAGTAVAAREGHSARPEASDDRSQGRFVESLVRENAALRRLLDFRESCGFRTVACEVIARDDGSGWWQTIRLGKGRAAGISENMAVMTPAGLVGKTIEVSGESCDVLLLSDRNFKVSVRFEQEGVFGVLCGGGVSLQGEHRFDVLCAPAALQADYLRNDAQIKRGETVVTSGLGGVFPPGLVVGRVRRIYSDESGLYRHAEVIPACDLARLDMVLVVLGGRG